MTDTSVVFDIIGKDKASGVMKGIGAAAGAMFSAFAVGKVFDIGKDAIESASNLAETQSKVNVLFGQGAGAVDRWADSAGRAFGQSKQQALDAASTFAIFGKSAGLSGQNLVSFSQDLTGLATDMASFSNTSVQEAIDAIGSALRGESEPIRAYGVLLDDASLKAKALELGLAKGTSSTNEIKAAQVSALSAQKAYNDAIAKHGKDSLEAQKASVALTNAQSKLKSVTEGTIAVLTPQQRVIAAQALIMDQTTAAQGDFSRTSAGLANQQRIMAAQFENAKAALGAGLLPMMLKFTGGLVQVIGFVQANKGWLTPLAIGLGVVAVAIWAVTTAQTAWNVAMTLNPIGAIIAVVIALVAAIVYLWTHSAAFRNFFIGIWHAVWGFLKSVGAWFAGPFVDFFVAAGHAIAAPFVWLWHNVLEPFGHGVAAVFSFIANIVSSSWHLLAAIIMWFGRNIFEPVMRAIAATANWLWSNVLSPVFQGIAFGAHMVATVAMWLWHSAIEPAFQGIAAAAQWVWNHVINPVFSAVMSITKKVGDTMRSVFSAIGGFISGAFSTAAGIVKGAINGVIGVINSAIGGINTVINMANKIPGVNFPHIPTLPKLDVGGDVLRSGLAVIHSGERVVPAAQVRALPRGGGGGPMELRITGNGGLARAVHEAVRAGDVRLYDSAGELISVTA